MFLSILFLVIGLILLTVGSEVLVRGASRLAITFGISPLVVGLTVVAFGTSAPELFVSLLSAIQGQSDIAIGNVVGSNICNILFILGLCAVITPLNVNQQLVRIDVPLMIAVSVVFLLMALDRIISRFEGLLLFLGLVGYVYFSIVASRKESKKIQEQYSSEFGTERSSKPQRDWIMVGAGLLLLTIGAKMMVDSAVFIARSLGFSELVIGLTVVALGTSLPEVATSLMAAIKKERDIAVGNIIGSNIYNILCILGLTSIVMPIPVNSAALTFDIPIMVAAAAVCLPIFFRELKIARWEGAFLFFYYLAYTTYLVLAAGKHSALPVYSNAMLFFVIPLSVVTMAVLGGRQWLPGGKGNGSGRAN